MARFGRVLRRAERALRVPSLRRARLLEEVALDLEGAYGAYRARGFGEEEAARRAEELLGPSEETAGELGRLHASPYARLLDRFSTRGAHRFERALLIGLVVVAVALGARGILAVGGPRLDAPAVWAVLALGAAAAWVVAADRLADLRGAAPPAVCSADVLATLASAALIVGVVGAAIELWRHPVAEPGALTALAVAAAVGHAAELLALGLLVALLAFVGGFSLGTRRRAATRQRARIPGLENPSSEEVGT